MSEKFKVGPEHMIFNLIEAPVLEKTLKVVATYQSKLSELQSTFAAESKALQERYTRSYQTLVKDTTDQLTSAKDKKMTKTTWPWTRIKDTHLFEVAHYEIIDNALTYKLAYHNIDHVRSMYKYLADTNEPYSEALDWAILFHDIVYDDKPNKESRSAELFLVMASQYEGCSLSLLRRQDVVDMILATATHEYKTPLQSAIIRADLHALTDSVAVYYNFYNILQESKYLYNLTDVEVALASENFMGGLLHRVAKNSRFGSTHAAFYHKVQHGIRLSLSLAETLQGRLL